MTITESLRKSFVKTIRTIEFTYKHSVTTTRLRANFRMKLPSELSGRDVEKLF